MAEGSPPGTGAGPSPGDATAGAAAPALAAPAPAPAPGLSLPAALALLGDSKHLQREKGLKALSALLQAEPADAAQAAAVEAAVMELLAADSWERKLGGLMGGKAYVCLADYRDLSQPFLEPLRGAAMGLLEDGEVRVRMAVGDVLKALAQRGGVPVFEACAPQVLGSISRNFDRTDAEGEGGGAEGEGGEGPDGQTARGLNPMREFLTESPALPGSPTPEPAEPQPRQAPADAGGAAADGADGAAAAGAAAAAAAGAGGVSAGSLVSALLKSTYRQVRPGQGEMRHGTEGWKCLETSMKALQALVEGCGAAIGPLLDEPLRELLYRALHHPNRFVRETGHFTMCTVCEALRGPGLVAISPRVAELLSDGMGDNWSQVRYAACVSTRSLLEWLGEGPDREALMPTLLPPMCLNRYYVAEGVRRYAQETWRLVMGEGGRAAVARHIGPVVGHYTAQSRANNHAVREAACACIAELLEKVDRAAVSPHVPALLRSLVVCFKDMSWPVRDAACIAAGRAVLAYPEEMRPLAPEVLSLWLAHLADNIPTVRANSAAAAAKALRAYGDEVLPALLAALNDMLLRAREQPAESSRYSGLSNETRFGVAERHARDQDPKVHADQEMFSCGSLMARFSTSYLIKSDGCMDHGFSRDKEPWEVSDGAVHMLRELAAVRPTAVTDEHLQGLAEIGGMASFQHAFNLHETVWRSLLPIGQSIGKPRFKRHLRALLVPLLADCRCGHQLAEAAAQAAVEGLRAWIGPNIFAGYLPEGVDAAALFGPGDKLLVPQRPALVGLLGVFAQRPPALPPPEGRPACA
ncbi:hypothetical protein HYH02_004216 [Chlamydomonas schloesseri]|uniref:TOG domain-containing protein n=1 Tax=Chlamydomonas schloesseri TaxID=2026947 RepID=A0A835WNA7_9CHLO|nr:hypothetical protein HYH02_004216 [Chlamydomonas schloesseri]|eukprot:KAG2450944.1 hypothetical protein HYH02_004216 [Chlamydomonas schloesseri]